MINLVDNFWDTYLRSATSVLGVHIRGTDKIASSGSGRVVEPDEYFDYIDSFLVAHPESLVFLATDSEAFSKIMLNRYTKVLVQADVLRSESNILWQDQPNGVNYRKGRDVLMDVLLLSKCQFFIHAASSVSEAVFYFNMDLHNSSVHLQYNKESRKNPSWLRSRRSLNELE